MPFVRKKKTFEFIRQVNGICCVSDEKIGTSFFLRKHVGGLALVFEVCVWLEINEDETRIYTNFTSDAFSRLNVCRSRVI